MAHDYLPQPLPVDHIELDEDLLKLVGTDRFDAIAIETEGDERLRAFDEMVAAMPRFGDYQTGVDRQIPIFKLVRK